MASGDSLFRIAANQSGFLNTCGVIQLGPSKVFSFEQGVLQYIRVFGRMPDHYSDGGAVVRFNWTPEADPGAGGTFLWEAGMDLRTSISDITTAPSMTRGTSSYTPGSGTNGNGLVLEVSLSASTNMDNVSAGDWFIFDFVRNGASGTDDATVAASVFDIIVREQ